MIKEEKISANNYILSSPAGERKYQQPSLIVNITVIQQLLLYMYVHIYKIVPVCQWRHVSLQPMVGQCRKAGLDINPGSYSPNKWDSLQAGRRETGCCFDEFYLITRFYQYLLKKKMLISLSSWSTILVLVKCTIYEHILFWYL